MKIIEKHLFWLWSSVAGQTILVIFGFYNLVTDGQHRVFMSSYDGMRNYFAFNEYIRLKTDSSYFLFEQLNYPFGDYILYSDNTPLFAFLIKWFSEHIYDISAHSLQIYHWLLIFSIVFSTLLLYLIGKNIIKTKWLLAVFSITIPWITPQLFRFGDGHYGLGLSCCLLAAIYGLVVLYQRFQHQKNIVLPIIGIIISVVVSAFIHVYFLLISGFFIGYFCLTWAVYNWKNRSQFWKLISMSVVIPLMSFGIFMLIVRSIDTYYSMRSITARGFHFDRWHLKADGLFHSHYFYSIPFFKTPMNLHYESIAYLGSFAWYSLIVFSLIFITKKFKLKILKEYLNSNKTAQLVSILIISGIACLIIAFGTKAHFFNNSIKFDNWLNPLFWMEKFIPQTTQFRCMARMNWMFYLTFNFLLLYLLDTYFQRNPIKWYRKALVIILPLLLIIDTKDTIQYWRPVGKKQPLNNEQTLAPVRDFLQGINTEDYQAILPLPYYNSGSEDYNYTIDAEKKWTILTFQLSHLTNLPLMASQTGRLPLNQTYAFFDIFVNYEVPELIRNELSEKPILVIYSNMDDSWKNIPKLEPAQTAMNNGKDFPEKMNMLELKRNSSWILYEWNPK